MPPASPPPAVVRIPACRGEGGGRGDEGESQGAGSRSWTTSSSASASVSRPHSCSSSFFPVRHLQWFSQTPQLPVPSSATVPPAPHRSRFC